MRVAIRWKMTAEEAAWCRGGGGPVISRQYGFVLAAAVSFGLLSLGMAAMLEGEAEWASWRLLTAAALFILGWKVLHGDARASLAIIALLPVIIAPGHVIAYVGGHAYYVEHLAFWLVIATLALAAIWRVFYLAYRAERRRASALNLPSSDFLDAEH